VIRRHPARAIAFASLAAILTPAATHAQGGAPVYPIPFRAMIGLNPLGIPFDIGSVEVEGAILPGVTLAGAASYNALGDDSGEGSGDPRFTSGDVKVRYYPGEVALRGFSVGLGIGVTRYSENVATPTPTGPTFERQAITAPTISVLADYNFLLGARQRFVVGTGIGAKRLLASEEDRRRADAPRAYPFVRFLLGIAF
jgi:hypothetical protein